MTALERLCGQKVEVNDKELRRFHRVLQVQKNLQGDVEIDLVETLVLKFMDTCKTVGVLAQVFWAAAVPSIKQLETFIKDLYDDSDLEEEKVAS